LERSGDIKIVVETISDKGVRNVFGGVMPAATLYAKMAFIEANPRTIQALANAMVRALRWLTHATAEDVAKTVPEEYLLGDRALYLAAFEKVRSSYSTDGVISAKMVDNAYQVLLAHNAAVRRAPVLHLKQTYDNRFAEAARQKFQ
jgi:NitT/TauT family transport system substrate-binding protein